MNKELKRVFEAQYDILKQVAEDFFRDLAEYVRKACEKIAAIVREFLSRVKVRIHPCRISAHKARIEAVRCQWRARGPRRNIALMRAIMARRTV